MPHIFTRLSIIILASATILFSSCDERMYFPSRATAPGLREQFDTKLVLSLKAQMASTNGDTATHKHATSIVSPAVDFAFSPVNHLGLTFSYNGITNRAIGELGTSTNAGVFNGHRFDGGAGYYTNFGRLGFFEGYVGAGGGYLQRKSFYSSYEDFSAHYTRFYLQPAAGIGNSIFMLTGGMRLALQHFNDFKAGDSMLRYKITNRDNYVGPDVTSQTFIFWEPFINFEIGYKYVKFNVQTGFSSQLAGGTIIGSFPVYVSMGIVLNFAPRFVKSGNELPHPPGHRKPSRDETE